MRARLAIVAAGCVLAVASVGRAQQNPYLGRARAELDELKYDKARDSLDQAIKMGKSSPADLAQIYRMSGEVAAALGQPDAALAYFKLLLEIDPAAKLAEGVSPKIKEPFEASRAFFDGKEPLRVRHELPAGSSTAVTVVVVSDPLGMVAGARATYRTTGGQEQSVEGHGRGKIQLVLPRTARLEVLLAAIDEHGNRLVEIGSPRSPIVVEMKQEGPVGTNGAGGGGGGGGGEGGGGRAFYARWWLWGGVAVAFAGAGTYFGLAAKGAEDDLAKLNMESMAHDFTEAKAIEDRARRNALLANVTFGAAGAFAVAATILVVRDLTAKRPPREKTAVVPMPTRGGAGVAVVVSF